MTRGTTNVLLLDPEPRFLHSLPADLRKKGFTVIEVASPEAALDHLELANGENGWDMFLVNEVFLQNGVSRTTVRDKSLVRELRSRFVDIPVAVLSAGTIRNADYSYKGLRMDPEGRPGYTTYIFKESEHAHGVLTQPDDVYWTIKLYKTVSSLLRAEGWLEYLARKWDFHVGISIVDRSYRLQYVNEFQRRISCRKAIQIGGICWMEYNPSFHQVQHCSWCPVAKACRAKQPCTSTTISPIWRSGQPSSKNDRNLGQTSVPLMPESANYRFYEVRAFPVQDPETKEFVATLELVFLRTEEMLDKCRSAILKGPKAFRNSLEEILGHICDLGFDRARFWLQNLDSRYLDGLAAHGRHDRSIVGVRLDQQTDRYFRRSLQTDRHFYCNGKQGPPAKEIRGLRKPGTPWVEVPVWVKNRDVPIFVGKINVDNELSRKPLHWNKYFWPFLDKYAEMLGPVIWEAREYWRRRERAQQAETLRQLDVQLVDAKNVQTQMEAILRCVRRLLEPDHCHIRLRQGNELTLMAPLEHSGRVRRAVSIADDTDTSVSAWYANHADGEPYQILGRATLRCYAQRLRRKGRLAAAKHFKQVRSCAIFGLRDSQDVLLGTLVLDSKRDYFFDEDRISVANDLVHRAQVLVASSLAHERLGQLVNALEPEVAVLGRQANLILHNNAWSKRTRLPRTKGTRPALPAHPFAEMSRCSVRDSSLFDHDVRSVFKSGRATRLVARFDGPDGKERHMAVIVNPFEKDDLGEVQTVVVVLSDITDMLSVEAITEKAAVCDNLPRALKKPLRDIRRLFNANQVSVTECPRFGPDDCPVRIRCRATPSGITEQREQTNHQLSGVGQLLSVLRGFGYLAIPDVNTARGALSEEIRKLLLRGRIKSLLATPIYLTGEPWGVLSVSFTARRTFSGHDIHLLRAAAAQISLLVLLSQQAELRTMDREITAGLGRTGGSVFIRPGDVGILDEILRQAIRLTGCKGGHIRVIDWDRGELVLKAAENDPLVQVGKSKVRAKLRLGEPVSGEVALSGVPRIVNHREEFDPRILQGIPSVRHDVRTALGNEQSFACFPLISGDEVLGTATLTSNTTDFFVGRRRQLLEDFMQRASLALHASRQLERLEEMSGYFDQEMNVEALGDLWPKLPQMAVKLFLAEAASVSSLDDSGRLRREGFCCAGDSDYNEPLGEVTNASNSPHCGLSRWVAYNGGIYKYEGRRVFTHRYLSKPGMLNHSKLPSGHFKSIMLARLDTPQGKPMGVLRVINRKGRQGELGFTEFDEALMRLLNTKLAIAIERLRLMESRNRLVELRNRSIAGTAHDLKTPLQNIRWTLGVLMERLAGAKEFEQVRLSFESSRLLDAFILSTVEVAQGKPDRTIPSKIKTIDVIREALDVLQPEFNQDRWQFKTLVYPSAKEIYADRAQLLRALLNLCHNAWKHGRAQDDGLASGAQQNLLEITASRVGDRCEIKVADHGPGRRSKSSPADHALSDDKGHGVGLASVELIAKAHGGQMVVGERDDGASGFQACMAWNAAALRRQQRRATPGAGNRTGFSRD